MESLTTYSFALLKSIGKMSRISANYHLFSLNNSIRNRVIALDIRRQKIFTPYRRSRGGSTSQMIRTHITSLTKPDRFCTQHIPKKTGVNHNNLVQINPSANCFKAYSKSHLLECHKCSVHSWSQWKNRRLHWSCCSKSSWFVCGDWNLLNWTKQCYMGCPPSSWAMLFRINQGQMGCKRRSRNLLLWHFSNIQTVSWRKKIIWTLWRVSLMAQLLYETVYCLPSTLFNLPPYHWCHIYAWIWIIPWYNHVGRRDVMHHWWFQPTY